MWSSARWPDATGTPSLGERTQTRILGEASYAPLREASRRLEARRGKGIDMVSLARRLAGILLARPHNGTAFLLRVHFRPARGHSRAPILFGHDGSEETVGLIIKPGGEE